MYKLELHHSERKSPPLLSDYLGNHLRIAKEFENEGWYLQTSEDQECPDLLVQDCLDIGGQKYDAWGDHCAFEFKFGMDLVNSFCDGIFGL